MPAPKRRVVITGLGSITSLGLNKEAFWDAACAGRSGVRPITHFDVADHATKIASMVEDFDPSPVISPREARRLDRYTQVALVAADEAVRDSGLDFEAVDRDRAGAVIGTGIGGITEIEEQRMVLHERGPRRVSPFLIPKLMSNAAAGHVAIRHGLHGPNAAVSSACASALHAVGDAFMNVAYDRADVMITGGTEAAVTALGLAGFISCKAVSTRNDEPEKASRPFDKDRDGFVMGEGAGVLVFEELGHARNRGAHVYAEVLGFGASCDAYHITAPAPDGRGAAASMTRALDDAGLEPTEVDYINAHGTSTQLNDAMETNAVKIALGEHAYRVAISSTKSMIGHLLGASGGAELVQTALTVDRGVICPTINYQTPDPACDLDYVPNEARQQDVAVALCNSFGFGGHNATVVLGKFTG
jgi:3-oxoacyl-[acyl-carrier-protein] synthase II